MNVYDVLVGVKDPNGDSYSTYKVIVRGVDLDEAAYAASKAAVEMWHENYGLGWEITFADADEVWADDVSTLVLASAEVEHG